MKPLCRRMSSETLGVFLYTMVVKKEKFLQNTLGGIIENDQNDIFITNITNLYESHLSKTPIVY